MTWLIASFALLGLALTAGFAWYERSRPDARVVALVACLAALAVIGRIAFAPLPNVKPTTDIVVLTGYALGGAPGFAVGAVAALVSNLFFGQGPWTPWQMVAWGLCGAGGALLARAFGRELGRAGLAAACLVAGVLYGGIMNLSLWVTYSGDHTLAKLITVFVTSAPFDLAHVLGNVAFCLAFGPALVRALRRFRARLDVRWAPAGAVAGLALLLFAAVPERAAAAEPLEVRVAAGYLAGVQNDDGGFGAAPGQASSQMHTGWAALGLAATGRNPRDVGNPDAITYMQAHAGDLDDLGDYARTVLALRAAGVSARDVGGRDLVALLARKQRRNGSWAGRVNTTAFALMALRSVGRSARNKAVRAGGRWIATQANQDGGFNFAGRGGTSTVDDTGAALQGLAAAGRRDTPTVRRALTWLRARQNPDGGFGSAAGSASNAQSTAWAVQGMIAVGFDPNRARLGGAKTPQAHLASLVAYDGAVRYSRLSKQTPVWVTAQVLPALVGRAFPLAAVPRAGGGVAAGASARPTATATATAKPRRRATAERSENETQRRSPRAAEPATLERYVDWTRDLPERARRLGAVLGWLAAGPLA